MGSDQGKLSSDPNNPDLIPPSQLFTDFRQSRRPLLQSCSPSMSRTSGIELCSQISRERTAACVFVCCFLQTALLSEPLGRKHLYRICVFVSGPHREHGLAQPQ